MVSLFQDQRKVIAFLPDWGRCYVEFRFDELFSIPAHLAMSSFVVKKYRLFGCRQLTVDDFKGVSFGYGLHRSK